MKKLLLLLIIPLLSFGQDCVDNLIVEAYCNENLNYVDFQFDYSCDCGTEFYVVGNGQSFGPFDYGEAYYTLGPFSDNDMICELIVQFCDNNITAESWGWCDDDMVGCETTVEEGCTEGDEFYPIGFQWAISDCSYYECVAVDEWILVDNCEDEGCWEDGEFYCIGCELFIDDCTYVECEGPNNWSDWIEIPDCGGNDCIDDPEDMLTQYGFSCSELLLTFGCDADLSATIPEVGFGISVYEICPETCTDCGQEEEGCWEDGELYADGDQYWLNECEFIYCEELGSWSEVIEIDDCEEEGCTEDDGNEFYPIGFQWEMSDCSYYECVAVDEWVFVNNCEEGCDTVYIEVPVIEYVEVIVTDTVIEYQDLIITEYIDCDTGLPCESGISEILDKSKTDGRLYNLLGQEINRREGIYIEGGEVKYRLQ